MRVAGANVATLERGGMNRPRACSLSSSRPIVTNRTAIRNSSLLAAGKGNLSPCATKTGCRWPLVGRPLPARRPIDWPPARQVALFWICCEPLPQSLAPFSLFDTSIRCKRPRDSWPVSRPRHLQARRTHKKTNQLLRARLLRSGGDKNNQFAHLMLQPALANQTKPLPEVGLVAYVFMVKFRRFG